VTTTYNAEPQRSRSLLQIEALRTQRLCVDRRDREDFKNELLGKVDDQILPSAARWSSELGYHTASVTTYNAEPRSARSIF
jgi:hypothetical protein